MNYPDDFNVPTFAAGKSIAVSRAMGIGIMSAFLIIIFLCGLLVWTVRSQRVDPYILATGGVNDQWYVIAPGGIRPEIEMTHEQIIQESVIWKFVQNWFTISGEPDINSENWDTSCTRTDCDTSDASTPCKIFCATSDTLFRRFTEDVLPTYEYNAQNGIYWTPNVDSIRISPIGTIIDAGGTWRVQMTVSAGDETMDIMAYIKLARSPKAYPKTMGYYIADFNAYRMK